MIESLNGFVEILLTLLVGFGVAYGAYQGAKRQTARSMQPLVGDPPIESDVPLTRRVDQILSRMDRLDERQLQSETEVSRLRDEVIRTGRDLDRNAADVRTHEERLGRLDRRVDNIERKCGMQHRSDSDKAAV